MLNRHSLFWKLAVLLVTFCLLVISLNGAWVRQIELKTAYLAPEARQVLQSYADQAARAVEEGGPAVDAFLNQLRAQEQGLMAVLDDRLQPLGSLAMPDALQDRLTAMRRLDWPMSRRLQLERPIIHFPFGM